MENHAKTKMNVRVGHMTVTFYPNVQIYLAVILVHVALEHLEMEHTAKNCLNLLYNLPQGADQTVLVVVAMALEMAP